MTDDFFGPLTEVDSDRGGGIGRRVPGLRYATVERKEDAGYVLNWLSGTVRVRSSPARIASPMAGGGRGAYFMPEPGDEVIVGFEDGDLDRPVILGALWNEVDAPPESADTSSDNNTRTIVSRQGHELTFDDSPGAGKVLLKSKGGLEVSMDDGSKTLTLKVDGSNAIEISPAGVKIAGTRIDLN